MSIDQTVLKAELSAFLDDFRRIGHSYVWREGDLVAMLYARLCANPAFQVEDRGLKYSTVHHQWPARGTSRGPARGTFDLAVLDQGIATQFARNKASSLEDTDIARSTAVEAVIDVTQIRTAVRSWQQLFIDNDIERVAANQKQSAHAYLLVCAHTDPGHSYTGYVADFLKANAASWRQRAPNLEIGCSPSPSGGLEPFWIA
jgi:hypothetical protein